MTDTKIDSTIPDQHEAMDSADEFESFSAVGLLITRPETSQRRTDIEDKLMQLEFGDKLNITAGLLYRSDKEGSEKTVLSVQLMNSDPGMPRAYALRIHGSHEVDLLLPGSRELPEAIGTEHRRVGADGKQPGAAEMVESGTLLVFNRHLSSKAPSLVLP